MESALGVASLADQGKKKKKSRLKWRWVIPVHVLIFALAISLSQPIKNCAEEVGSLLKKSSEEAEHFMMEHPLEFDSLESFRGSRAHWHRDFDELLRDVAKDYKTIIADEGYDGYCTARYPIIIFIVDSIALLIFVLTAGYLLFQDATTSFGASGYDIFVAVNGLVGMFIVLGVVTFPSLNLMRLAVKLSAKLEDCTKELKEAQRSVVAGGLDLDQYNLHAQVWDGMVFGVREPIFNYVIDRNFEDWFWKRLNFLLAFGAGVTMFLVYRTNVKSLVRWRAAIPSVVCIGVTFPSSSDPNKLWRLGSGCIVSGSKGLILTNWHLFQRMGVDASHLSRDTSDHSRRELHRLDSDVWSVGSNNNQRNNDSPLFGPMSSPWKATTNSDDEAFLLRDSLVTNMVRESQMESMKKSLQHLREGSGRIDDDESFKDLDNMDDELNVVDEYGVPLHSVSAPAILFKDGPQISTATTTTTATHSTTATNPKLHRHLTNQSRFAESLADVFPDMKVYIGTVSRGHPKWEYEAEFTGVESPSTEFTPFGLDLLLLKIKGRANFTGLRKFASGLINLLDCTTNH